MVEVESSMIKEVEYNEEENSLQIKFKNESIYKYFDVPLQIYKEFLNAESKGKFFHAKIAKKFTWNLEEKN
tara:strand:+ start:125 stop:337 length:213 start_codon:yes stop_codon:yes gene_type:complete